MATLTEDKVRTASLSSTSSPRNFSKPSAPSSPALRGEPMATALATTPPIPARPFPPPAVVAGVHRGWKPLGFLSILRNVLVKTPFWLTWLRILQSLLAGVVIGCLVWNLTFDDFSGYHDVTIALLFAAAWTLFPTTVLTWPLKDLRHVFDPRLTLFADGLATALWGMTFASYHAVLWNIETRTKFWATAEGPQSMPATAARPISTLRMPSILPTMAGLSPVPVPTSVIAPGRFSIGERSLIPHHAVSLEARGTRLLPKGLVSNHDANTAWTLGLIASYVALAEFLLYALTTIIFAYYYHSALVADTATSAPSRASSSFATSVTPPLALHTEKVSLVDLEANHSQTVDLSEEGNKCSVGEGEKKGLIGKIVASLGTKGSPLRKHNEGQSQANDSGVFGLEGKNGIEVTKSNGKAAEVEGGTEVAPIDVKLDGTAAR